MHNAARSQHYPNAANLRATSHIWSFGRNWPAPIVPTTHSKYVRQLATTTLLYRALVECMRSWDPDTQIKAKPRTLAIYLDLNKCQSVGDSESADYEDFEHDAS
jgi:hypothetical protein